jgi:calcineurin-like phosphoesterase family protein
MTEDSTECSAGIVVSCIGSGPSNGMQSWRGRAMGCRVAVITDLHYAASPINERRFGHFAHVLLMRTVERLNRALRPDVTVVLGDLVDDPAAADVVDRLAALRDQVSRLHAPVIVIPGNHDPAPAAFYEVFSRPNPITDIAGVRFVSFIDEQTTSCHATRADADLSRLREAREAHDGPVVALQHVPAQPAAIRGACPFAYTNLDAVMADMAAGAVTLSLSGHYHPGLPLQANDGTFYLTMPALCEPPFQYAVLDVSSSGVTADFQSHGAPSELETVVLGDQQSGGAQIR